VRYLLCNTTGRTVSMQIINKRNMLRVGAGIRILQKLQDK